METSILPATDYMAGLVAASAAADSRLWELVASWDFTDVSCRLLVPTAKFPSA